jgi:Family of unknown function (DUF5996)
MSYPPTPLVRAAAQLRQRSVLAQVYLWMTAGLLVTAAVAASVARSPRVLNLIYGSPRPAPERAWPARWMALAADQEQALAGFWPGNRTVPEPAFCAYISPEPPGCREAAIQPDAAYYHRDVREFILPYEAVRRAAAPDRLILDFFQSAYEVGAILAGWDRAALERPDPLASRRQVP